MLQSNTDIYHLNPTNLLIFRDEKNLDKSRYRDVIPGELTRVKLQPDIDDKHDFINANYVSGYRDQEKAYIFTQGK
jgi:protein tyrosine phosphatase